jgi:hypothetical protein
MVGWEIKFGKSILDVVGVSTKGRIDKRITIIEVKRTRSDLLADLKKGKLLKYEAQGTHCYLAATPEALRLDKLTATEVLQDLQDRGLPAHWGVLSINDSKTVHVVRSCKRHRPTPTATLQALVGKIGRASMWRYMESLGIVEPY